MRQNFGVEFEMDKTQFIGKHVRFVGCSELQLIYSASGASNPNEFCVEGKDYEIEDVKMFSFSSLVSLKEFPGKYFNTSCFNSIDFGHYLFTCLDEEKENLTNE
jgi:hypothetical protein